jgi:hypothetical protein
MVFAGFAKGRGRGEEKDLLCDKHARRRRIEILSVKAANVRPVGNVLRLAQCQCSNAARSGGTLAERESAGRSTATGVRDLSTVGGGVVLIAGGGDESAGLKGRNESAGLGSRVGLDVGSRAGGLGVLRVDLAQRGSRGDPGRSLGNRSARTNKDVVLTQVERGATVETRPQGTVSQDGFLKVWREGNMSSRQTS